jgi:hypothetical protein
MLDRFEGRALIRNFFAVLLRQGAVRQPVADNFLSAG